MPAAKKTVKRKNNRGAKPKLNDAMRVKLEELASLDATITEMAYYCDVSRQAIYNWFADDPDLFDKIERHRANPILKARRRVIQGIDESYQNAMDYLKRKAPDDEFSEKQTLTVKETPIENNVEEDRDKYK